MKLFHLDKKEEKEDNKKQVLQIVSIGRFGIPMWLKSPDANTTKKASNEERISRKFDGAKNFNYPALQIL